MTENKHLHYRPDPDFAGQMAARPFFCPIRRAIAVTNRLYTFDDYCEVHGVSRFRTKTGECVKCARSVSDTPRAIARREGRSTYMATCPEHGETAHHVGRGNCATCFTSAGYRRVRDAPVGRPLSGGARALARQAGRKTYPAQCPEHGAAPHHVSIGKCAECFTTAGIRRAPRTDTNDARIVARRAGGARYVTTCAEHGETAHHVQTGRCLTCFTTAGIRRRPPADRNPARAQARREGRTSYRAECVTHGSTDHHVQTGKCLTCYNAMGYRRP